MKCSGKCYCGKDCKINHEKIAKRCTCNNVHNVCNKKCSKCNEARCAYIANHKTNFGRCLCLLCDHEEMVHKSKIINEPFKLPFLK